ncbi:hypothetical protein O0L34_g13807 [Tuta absoluta]|nr:hypothetical protein O0L34_g13807 [Tuta absoluta]
MLVSLRRGISLFALVYLFSFVLCENQDTHEKTLYVAETGLQKSRFYVINRDVESKHLERRKRDASTAPLAVLQKNISTWTTHLNDSHQQLMVHWVGEGSNVIICLARDSSPRNKGGVSPSALFISYDYGKNFTNKTDMFKLGDEPDSGYAQLDKFFNHPKYPEFCVFVDSTNKKLYYTSDNGKTIHRSDLTFSPSELAFDEEFPDKYVILDKVDSNRKLYLTLDGGKTFKNIQSFVKTFFWSSGPEFPKSFYVERWKPGGTSTVLAAADPVDMMSATKLFEDAKDFHIKGDYMFATKQSKENNTLDFYISHQRGPFFKADFQTELDLRKFHIADVTDQRIFVSVMHTETLANLYVSEISKNFTQYKFVLSLGQILCYFPDGNWKDSWLEDVTEDPFTDLYRVEGLKGIYIASKVDSKTPMANVGPEHLMSLITFNHGVTWSPINPPTEDENGKPLSCHIENSCSLHLCQKFSQLYPVTRSASIMSSKSAPGIIMATGVMGKSLKGIPGVYMSRDAGLTWKRILKDYYFFNYGDHGGVLVAVKYFKSRGETRKILYSTNEGIEWNSYEFNDDDLRIYGLMTEPGENTTTFTMFGSANEQHQWIIITIDLLNTFPRNCTEDDYKFWSPSPPNSTVSCVLGQRDTFQRRLAHTNCYNGINYDRPIKKQVCECSRRDFECDYGFKLSGDEECIRNKSVNFDPYAIPPECRPGHSYVRTKGYRKIDGDVCTISSYLAYAPDTIPCPIEEPQEFLIVALRDKIARIDLSDNTSVIPVQGQKNIVAVEFDIKNNCIYWADIQLDKISRQCFNDGTTQEVVVDTDLASIEGMALDYISNVLFFVDGMRKKIEAVRTDLSSQGRMRATILDYKVLSKPRGIAVHPRAGYLFWTDWDRSNPSVSRSNLDGKDVKKLFGKPIVQWPNGITIDQMAERIYWVDAMEDYIASSDLNGRYFRRILWNDDKVSHPFAVAVLKDKMYWDDWKAKSIFIADKDTGANIITINDTLSGLMDLKVFAHFVQHGSNACSYKNTSCDTLCLGGPGNTFSCLCPDGFHRINGKCMCPNGMEPAANMTCPKKAGGSCSPDQFSCSNGMCIAATWRCDGNNDCGDLSDEIGCQCTPPMIPCDDTRCYLPHWRCDGDIDCADMSDEKDCGHHNCSANEFQCGTGQCIEKKWVCDGDNDCKDGSDEKNCQITPKRPEIEFANCSSNGFACGNDSSAICIPNSWVCDGERDCPGGEDEKIDRCKNSTCAPYMFRCPTGKCIYKSWVCDGENDCGDVDAADEKNCSSIIGHSKLIPRPSTDKPEFSSNLTCLDWMFKCDNGNCLPYWWRCDSINDCGDNSDEVGCGMFAPESSSVSPEHDGTKQKCGKNQFQCSPGVCIPLQWVCDTADDCADGLDEKGCKEPISRHQTCAAEETPCVDGKGCVLSLKLCDGKKDCSDGSDEAACGRPTRKGQLGQHQTCAAEETPCVDGKGCVLSLKLCDGKKDCSDGSDEAACGRPTRKGQLGQHQTCAAEETPCVDGKGCVLSLKLCDGKKDCSDGSDEAACGRPTRKGQLGQHQTCAAEETPCVDGKGCVLSLKLCDGKKDCSDGSDEAACGRPTHKPTQDCPHGYFLCDDGTLCVSQAMVCNGHQDCYDGTDELNCSSDSARPIGGNSYYKVSTNSLQSDDGTLCVSQAMVCNGHQDCYDGTDELNCSSDSARPIGGNSYYKVSTNSLQSDDGTLCVSQAMVCNGHQDCYDGTDELNCSSDSARPIGGNSYYKVSTNSLQSDDGTLCVSQAMVCNGHQDCYDGTDELNCSSDSARPIGGNSYYKVSTNSLQSDDGTLCVSQAMVCNGHQDCYDGTDELNCSSDSARPIGGNSYYKVSTNSLQSDDGTLCVSQAMVCNGHQDCYDGTDELNCSSDSARPIGGNSYYKVSTNSLQSDDGTLCVSQAMVCNGHQDCYDGTDELNCSSDSARPIGGNSYYKVSTNSLQSDDGTLCVSQAMVCNGHQDCYDGTDELNCSSDSARPIGGNSYYKVSTNSLQSDDGTLCVSQAMVCNGHQDCYDGTDELNCSSDSARPIGGNSYYKLISIGVDQLSINSSSFLISCWMPQQKTVQYSFLPSIARVADGIWKNTTWTNDTVYRFTDLEPFTNYNVTFYIRDSLSKKIYAANKYVNTTTGEGVPSPPGRLTVRQLIGSRVDVVWDPPLSPRGVIKAYTIYYTPPVPPNVKVVPVTWHPPANRSLSYRSTVTGYFEPKTKYAFWVTAQNGAHTSESSEVSELIFEDIGDVDDLANVSMARLNQSAVYLEWHKIRGIEGYLVSLSYPRNYQTPPSINTTSTNVTLTNLPTGVQVYVNVYAFKGDIFGNPFTIPLPIVGEKDETLNVTAMLIKEKGTTVKVSWSPPKADKYKNKELEYQMYYSHVKGSMSNSGMSHSDSGVITRNTSVTVDGLHACESYVFVAGLLHGPLSAPVEIMTRENAKAPIKNLHAKFVEDKSQLKIVWNANCDVIREPVAYWLDIVEVTRNRSSSYLLSATVNTTLSHVVNNVPVGGRYKVCVNANVPDAAVTCAIVRSRPLPAPQGVVAWQSPNGHIMVSWQQPAIDKVPDEHEFEVIVSEKEIPEEMLHPSEEMKTAVAATSPVLISAYTHTSPLYVSVRTRTKDGYYSDISEVQTLQMEGLEDSVIAVGDMSGSGPVWWGAGAAVVVGVALGGALLHLALRHRRLTRSFLHFTAHTPRYDSRRGQATITDHDDDDVPPIHGFSDDEPLVIA